MTCPKSHSQGAADDLAPGFTLFYAVLRLRRQPRRNTLRDVGGTAQRTNGKTVPTLIENLSYEKHYGMANP